MKRNTETNIELDFPASTYAVFRPAVGQPLPKLPVHYSAELGNPAGPVRKLSAPEVRREYPGVALSANYGKPLEPPAVPRFMSWGRHGRRA